MALSAKVVFSRLVIKVFYFVDITDTSETNQVPPSMTYTTALLLYSTDQMETNQKKVFMVTSVHVYL